VTHVCTSHWSFRSPLKTRRSSHENKKGACKGLAIFFLSNSSVWNVSAMFQSVFSLLGNKVALLRVEKFLNCGDTILYLNARTTEWNFCKTKRLLKRSEYDIVFLEKYGRVTCVFSTWYTNVFDHRNIAATTLSNIVQPLNFLSRGARTRAELTTQTQKVITLTHFFRRL
jgi:hypothetical protein